MATQSQYGRKHELSAKARDWSMHHYSLLLSGIEGVGISEQRLGTPQKNGPLNSFGRSGRKLSLVQNLSIIFYYLEFLRT